MSLFANIAVSVTAILYTLAFAAVAELAVRTLNFQKALPEHEGAINWSTYARAIMISAIWPVAVVAALIESIRQEAQKDRDAKGWPEGSESGDDWPK